jgi:hypothetical protein
MRKKIKGETDPLARQLDRQDTPARYIDHMLAPYAETAVEQVATRSVQELLEGLGRVYSLTQIGVRFRCKPESICSLRDLPVLTLSRLTLSPAKWIVLMEPCWFDVAAYGLTTYQPLLAAI